METPFPYLTDRRDRALFAGAPMFMVPRMGPALPELEAGRVRYLAAADGIYVEGRSQAVHGRIRVSPAMRLPYGGLTPMLSLLHGPIPTRLMDEAKAKAAAQCPSEWAGLFVWTGSRYELVEPPILSASMGHITYDAREIDKQTIALDLHSHGDDDAFFSGQDDRDDALKATPAFFAGVLGRCRADRQFVHRLVVHAHGWEFATEAHGRPLAGPCEAGVPA